MVGGPIWMLKKFFGLIWVVSLLIQIGLAVAYYRYYKQHDQPGPAEVPVPMVVAEAVDEVVKQVPPALPEAEVELRPTLVLPLKNDHEGLVANALRQALSKDGRYRSVAVKKGLFDQFLAKLQTRKREVTDLDEAIELAKDSGAKVLILGQVDKLKTGDESAVLTISLEMYQVDDKAKIFGQTFTSEKKPEPAEIPTAVSDSSPKKNGWLYGGLACFAIFWPLLLMPAMRRVIQAENNVATAAMLTMTIFVPLAIGWTFLFGDGWGLWSVVSFLASGAVVALWAIFVMTRVAEAETY